MLRKQTFVKILMNECSLKYENVQYVKTWGSSPSLATYNPL